MAKLEIEFRPSNGERYEQLHFKQEGMRGLKLPGCWLPEFLAALEDDQNTDRICIYQNYWLEHTKYGCQFYKSASDTPLLSLDVGQCAKLTAHIKSTYAALL